MLDLVPGLSGNVQRMSAFGDWSGAAGEGLAIGERRGLAVFELAAFGRGEAARESLSAALGVALPAANRSAEAEGVAALSIGPGRWLIVAADAAIAGLPEPPDTQAAVTDLTGGRAILTLTGPRAAPTLMKGTAIDLGPASFPEGAVAATALARMPVTIWRQAAGYDVIVPRSYAVSLLEWLLQAGGL
jgi:heterotetrameric sarcosine oxidase gamma subunit